MTRFIWVRDRNKVDHYINVDHIIRVTKRPPDAHNGHPVSYLTLINDGQIALSQDTYDTADDVITKIQVASV